MIKVCSLDFLNKEQFGADIMASNGKLLYSSNDDVTPDRVLQLYFKEIFINDPAEIEAEKRIQEEAKKEAESKEAELKAVEALKKEKELEEKLKADLIKLEADEIDENTLDEETKARVKEFAASVEIDENGFIKFDEAQAERVSGLSKQIGTMFNYNESKLEELATAAYYCRIGVTKFRKKDIYKKGFKKVQAKEGYDLLLNKKMMSPAIADAVKFCADDYNVAAFNLAGQIPYASILAVALHYDYLTFIKNMDKEEALKKMLQFGGNKFNIFVLHKFITMMREHNDK